MSETNEPEGARVDRVARRHRTFGWCSLVFYLTLGLVLEALHGIKAELYLLPANTLRRELWTLAHAHGSLMAMLNLLFAASLAPLEASLGGSRRRLVSHLLIDGALLLPIGFFLGGAFANEHDPWSGIWLAPIGAVCVIVAVALIAAASLRSAR